MQLAAEHCLGKINFVNVILLSLLFYLSHMLSLMKVIRLMLLNKVLNLLELVSIALALLLIVVEPHLNITEVLQCSLLPAQMEVYILYLYNLHKVDSLSINCFFACYSAFQNTLTRIQCSC